MINTDDINNAINANKHNPEVVTDNICDGFHTFGQLYFQRMTLFATLVNLFPELSWKTERHEDGELCFGGGWFLVTIDTPVGAYGYHYEMKYWDKFNCPILKKAKHWDGYTEENVDRLFSLIDVKDWYSLVLDKNGLKKRDETIAQWHTNQFPKQDML